ncbi:unnamed protein product [Bathycoccus prasinos]|jgi:hypothetical protein
MTDEEGLLFDRFGEIIADASDAIDAMMISTISISTKKRHFKEEDEDEEATLTSVVAEQTRSIKYRVKALAKEYLTLRAAANKATKQKEESSGGEQLRDALLQARVDAAERENAKLKMALKEAKEDCALLVRAVRMAREEFTRLDKLEEEEEEEGFEEDDDAVTVKSLASSGGATYGSGVQTLFAAQDEDEEDEEDDGRGRGRNETQSLHDILDLDDQYNAALEKLRTANISSSAATAVANDYDDSTHNSSLAASIARKNAAQNKDEVTETVKAAAMFAATAALYSHSGLNAVPNSGGKNTNKSSTSEVSSGTTSKSGGQTPAAALCVDDESDQGQVFRTPVLVVSDHPDALSSSDEDKELDGEGSMQNALERVFFGDDDEDEVDSPSGFGTTTTKKRGENKMSFLNALPP